MKGLKEMEEMLQEVEENLGDRIWKLLNKSVPNRRCTAPKKSGMPERNNREIRTKEVIYKII